MRTITGVRAGYFYQFFDQDALIVARVLGLTVQRVRGTERPHVGFGVWNAQAYTDLMRQAGYDLKLVSA